MKTRKVKIRIMATKGPDMFGMYTAYLFPQKHSQIVLTHMPDYTGYEYTAVTSFYKTDIPWIIEQGMKKEIEKALLTVPVEQVDQFLLDISEDNVDDIFLRCLDEERYEVSIQEIEVEVPTTPWFTPIIDKLRALYEKYI